jgi:hypothetical protein
MPETIVTDARRALDYCNFFIIHINKLSSERKQNRFDKVSTVKDNA